MTTDERVLNSIYRERDQVVSALSKCFPAWIGPVDDAEPGWSSAVYIDLPTGQVSWHVPDGEVPELFGHLQHGGKSWDGHTTDEKYARLAALDADPLEDVLQSLTNDEHGALSVWVVPPPISEEGHEHEWYCGITLYRDSPDHADDEPSQVYSGYSTRWTEAIRNAVKAAQEGE